MRIMFLSDTQSGSYYYRCKIPGKYLERRGHEVTVLYSDEQLKSMKVPEVMVLFRGYSSDGRPLIEMCRKAGIRVVFDTDDALDKVKRDNPSYASVMERMASVVQLPQMADVVTTTTRTLGKYLQKFNPQVAVLPNCMDLEDWKLRKFGNKRLRVGWTGSSSHLNDLHIALDAVADLQRRGYDFDFVVQGMTSAKTLEEWWDINYDLHGRAWEREPTGIAMRKMLRKLEKIRYEFHPFVPVLEYPEKLRSLNLDIGICPLAADDFNNKKSCIKFYEYALTGTVTLSSDVLPYNEELQYVAKNNFFEWRDKLGDLIRFFSEDMYKPQRDWVVENRDAAKKVDLWEKTYSK